MGWWWKEFWNLELKLVARSMAPRPFGIAMSAGGGSHRARVTRRGSAFESCIPPNGGQSGTARRLRRFIML